ncbi:MAG: hypothetical protein KKB59_19580 [Spirochaetes bacterium]|nr:hypothetical protein [Spirochaetota bacterium]
MTEIYIHINGEEFEKSKSEANESSKENDSESKDYQYDWKALEVQKLGFNNGRLEFAGSNDLGYFSINIDLELDTVIHIIESYMKKLGKLKTVLEATK